MLQCKVFNAPLSNMPLSDVLKFHSPQEILEFERQTLKSMLYIAEIQNCSTLKSDIQQALGSLHNRSFHFNSSLAIVDDPNLLHRSADIIIGAVIDVGKDKKYERFSYSISLVLNDRGEDDQWCRRNCFIKNGEVLPRIVRRFHFDYDIKDRVDQPMFHLQYAGKPEPSITNHFYCLEKWLEPPRLFFPPLSLSLVFDLVLREYRTVLGKDILDKSEWRKLIKESEKFMIKPYFEQCNKFFSDEGTYAQPLTPTFINWHYGKKK